MTIQLNAHNALVLFTAFLIGATIVAAVLGYVFIIKLNKKEADRVRVEEDFYEQWNRAVEAEKIIEAYKKDNYNKANRIYDLEKQLKLDSKKPKDVQNPACLACTVEVCPGSNCYYFDMRPQFESDCVTENEKPRLTA